MTVEANYEGLRESLREIGKGDVEKTSIVRIPGYGGFPVDSVAYWKVTTKHTAGGEDDILHVQFKTGGFLEIPTQQISEDEFVSLVYGIPF